jgi:demethylmenaquinone methyltransferase / 2-methoxy-6-polyprenyl-1,4-benzoquinol methylase
MAEVAAPSPSSGAAPAKGTRPAGTSDEADASRKVREMFTRIAPSYDRLNHLLSLQLDRVWRARVARELRPILQRADAAALDLCCGTGDLAFALERAGRAQVIGADFSHAMLVRARAKSVSIHGERSHGMPMTFFEADALRMPFAAESFDVVTTAFGFRNLANYEDGLREILRVLKPGGTLAILEFTEPNSGVLGNLYRWYFREVLPRIGGMISGDRSAYTYLPASVSRFFRPPELAALMELCGYDAVKYSVWTMGTVALHVGRKAG